MTVEMLFLLALVITVTIEICVLILSLKLLVHKSPFCAARVVFTGGLCSFATLPYVWFVLPQFVQGRMYTLCGEVFATVIEALILWVYLSLDIRRAAVISLGCNVSSYLAGLPIMHTIFTLID